MCRKALPKLLFVTKRITVVLCNRDRMLQDQIQSDADSLYTSVKNFLNQYCENFSVQFSQVL